MLKGCYASGRVLPSVPSKNSAPSQTNPIINSHPAPLTELRKQECNTTEAVQSELLIETLDDSGQSLTTNEKADQSMLSLVPEVDLTELQSLVPMLTLKTEEKMCQNLTMAQQTLPNDSAPLLDSGYKGQEKVEKVVLTNRLMSLANDIC